MNRLDPQNKTTFGVNRLANNIPEEDGGILDSVGGFLKKRFSPDSTRTIEKKREGELFLKIRNKEATDEDRKEYSSLLKKNINESVELGLGFGPASLPNMVRQSVTSSAIKTSAEKLYSQALGATKQKFKSLSDKVVPGLIKRGVTAFTRPGLLAKAEQELMEAGQNLENVIAGIPKDTMVSTKGIINSLGKYKNYFTVVSGGKRVIINQTGYDNVTKIQNTIKELGPKVSFDTIRKTRQIMDEIVTQGGKAFGRTLEEGSRIDAIREAGNAIRKLIAKKFPDVAKVNAEYTFWKNVDDILRETVERTKSQQEPIGEKIAEGAGAVAGMVSGKLGSAITGAIAFKWIKKIINSTGFRTINAVTRDRVADLIAKGKFGEASELIRRGAGVGLSKALSSLESDK